MEGLGKYKHQHNHYQHPLHPKKQQGRQSWLRGCASERAAFLQVVTCGDLYWGSSVCSSRFYIMYMYW